jgi:hypothetical protein
MNIYKSHVCLFVWWNIPFVVGLTQPVVTTIAPQAGDAFLMGVAYIKLSEDTDTMFISTYTNTILTIDTRTYDTSILAGNITRTGFADGANGIMDMPSGLVLLGTSDLLVADILNHRIRIISIPNENQEIQTWAGNGIAEIVDNPADAMEASILFPHIMCRDGLGNVFVVSDYSIRKIPPSGGIVTWVGVSDEHGDVDGNGTHARFQRITSCAGDDVGNILVVEQDANRIRRVSLDGEVTTLVVSPSNNEMSIYGLAISSPYQITFGGGSIFYFISLIGSDIRGITLDAQVTTITEEGVCSNPANDEKGRTRNIEYDIPHNQFYVSCQTSQFGSSSVLFYINKVSFTEIVTPAPTTLHPTVSAASGVFSRNIWWIECVLLYFAL